MKLYKIAAIIVAALSAEALAGCNSGTTVITTPPPQLAYTQVDRLGRPLSNELFAIFGRHDANNRDQPSDDPNVLSTDITTFMLNTANRSSAIAAAVNGLLVPDVLRADLSQTSPAGYLGIETNGLVGTKFGGRGLSDDVVDTTLGLAFGNIVPRLFPAVPDDGNENLQKTVGRTDLTLTTDNVSATTAPKHFAQTFPYLGPPQ